MHPETFIAEMKGFEMDLEQWPAFLEAHAELIAVLEELERNVKLIAEINRKNLKKP